MARSWKLYWTAVLVVAVGLVAWVLLNDRFEIVSPYSDGHGPDPGSPEYVRGQERRHRDLPIDTAGLVLLWVAFSGTIAAIVGVAARIITRWRARLGRI